MEPTLLHLDVSAGYWLFHDESRSFVTGSAPIIELHYTSSLNNPGLVRGDLMFTSSIRPSGQPNECRGSHGRPAYGIGRQDAASRRWHVPVRGNAAGPVRPLNPHVRR